MEITRLTQEVVDHYTKKAEEHITIQTALDAFVKMEEEKDGG